MPEKTSLIGTFFYPGPTEVRPEILQAMIRPMISHRGAEFRELFARLQPGLQEIFGTREPVCISTSSATGLMEAAVRAIPPGRVLSVVNGAFAQRFAQIAESVGHSVHRMEIPWGQAPAEADVDGVLARIGEEEPVAAVTFVHSETSTGALADVGAIAAVARRHGALSLVDSVTGIAGAEFRLDDWGVDFAFTGSQKAIAIPPGLSFVAVSARLLEAAQRSPARGYYLDIVELVRYALRSETPSTPALPLIYALEEQLGSIRAEGIAARVARHREMADMTARWVDRLSADTEGLGMLPPEGSRSPTVSVISLPASISGRDLARSVRALGFTIGSGYGDLAERTFRIGHMGDHTADGLARCLDACASALALAQRR